MKETLEGILAIIGVVLMWCVGAVFTVLPFVIGFKILHWIGLI